MTSTSRESAGRPPVVDMASWQSTRDELLVFVGVIAGAGFETLAPKLLAYEFTGSTGTASAVRRPSINTEFNRPPPQTSQWDGASGNTVAAAAAAAIVNCASVAAPSAAESPAIPLPAKAAEKSRRSSDFGPGRPK